MKKAIMTSAIALTLLMSGEALAQNAGGFTGPTIAPTSVKDAKNMSDDTAVVMVGKIKQNLGNEKYTFSDATGSITVEIDHEDWNGIVAGPDDLIEIHGEIDKDFTKDAKVDVNLVVKK